MSTMKTIRSSSDVPANTRDGVGALSDADLDSVAAAHFLSGVIKLLEQLQREREIKFLKGELDHL